MLLPHHWAHVLFPNVKEIGQDGMWKKLNPKAITSDERCGFMVKSKCKDGAPAVTMRNMSKNIRCKNVHVHKWFVLDGDNDATRIERMDTVMDDKKVLTLVNHERIPMLLEIQDTKHASPPNVSRGGVLHTNEAPGNCLAIALGRRSNVKVTMNTSPDRHIKTRDSCVFVRNVCDKSEHYLQTWASGCPSNATAQRHPHYMHEHVRCSIHRYTHVAGGSGLASHVVRGHQGRTSLGPRSGTEPPSPVGEAQGSPSDTYLGSTRSTIYFPHYATAHCAARTTSTVTVVQHGSTCGYAGATGMWGGINVLTHLFSGRV